MNPTFNVLFSCIVLAIALIVALTVALTLTLRNHRKEKDYLEGVNRVLREHVALVDDKFTELRAQADEAYQLTGHDSLKWIALDYLKGNELLEKMNGIARGFREQRDTANVMLDKLAEFREIVMGTSERVPLSAFLTRMLPHIDNDSWKDSTKEYITRLKTCESDAAAQS